MNPVPGAILTQGLHLGYAVDLGAPKGTPILASASGKSSLLEWVIMEVMGILQL